MIQSTLDDIVSHHLNTANMIMAQDLHSTTTNNLARLVTQCARVTPQSVHNKALKLKH